MSPAYSTALGVVAYISLFAAFGVVFLFVNLLLGKFVRPSNPTTEKLAIYECGEPAIGSSFVQFDLRFYVVALLFIIFDVEVAFFFPWGTAFGKATNLADSRLEIVETGPDGMLALTEQAQLLTQEMGVRAPSVPLDVPASLQAQIIEFGEPAEIASTIVRESANQLAWLTIVDIGIFFAVLMVGFAYVWRRGDLDWVRALSREQTVRGSKTSTTALPGEEQLLSV